MSRVRRILVQEPPISLLDRFLFAKRFRFDIPLPMDEAVSHLKLIESATYGNPFEPSTRTIKFQPARDIQSFAIDTRSGMTVTHNRVKGLIFPDEVNQSVIVVGFARFRLGDMFVYPILGLLLAMGSWVALGTIIATINNDEKASIVVGQDSLYNIVGLVVVIVVMGIGIRRMRKERASLIDDIGKVLGN